MRILEWLKPNRLTNFTNLFWHETTCFGQFFCPSSGVYSLYTQQWYMSYTFVDSFRAGSEWNHPCPARKLYKPVWHIPLLSVQWINSWWWTEELSETCRVSCQNKFMRLVHLFGFILKKVRGFVIYFFNNSRPCIDLIRYSNDTNKCTRTYKNVLNCKHSTCPTCFGQYFGPLQGSELQRMDISRYYKIYESMHLI
jgi:hypothetical protein